MIINKKYIFLAFQCLYSISFAQSSISIAPNVDDINQTIIVDKLEEKKEVIEEIIEEPIELSTFRRAVVSNNLLRVKKECELNCDINSNVFLGNNILNLSSSYSNYSMYQWALENGAQWNKNNLGQTPIHLVYSNHKVKNNIVDLIYQNYDEKKPIMSLKDNNGQTPIFYLAKNYNINLDLLKFYFSLPGADCNVKDKKGFTPIDFMRVDFIFNNFDYIKNNCDLFLNSKLAPIDSIINRAGYEQNQIFIKYKETKIK